MRIVSTCLLATLCLVGALAGALMAPKPAWAFDGRGFARGGPVPPVRHSRPLPPSFRPAAPPPAFGVHRGGRPPVAFGRHGKRHAFWSAFPAQRQPWFASRYRPGDWRANAAWPSGRRWDDAGRFGAGYGFGGYGYGYGGAAPVHVNQEIQDLPRPEAIPTSVGIRAAPVGQPVVYVIESPDGARGTSVVRKGAAPARRAPRLAVVTPDPRRDGDAGQGNQFDGPLILHVAPRR